MIQYPTLIPSFIYTYKSIDGIASGIQSGVVTNSVSKSTLQGIAKPDKKYRVYTTFQTGAITSSGSSLFGCAACIKLHGLTTHNLQRFLALYPSDIVVFGNRRSSMNTAQDYFNLEDKWMNTPYIVVSNVTELYEITTTFVQTETTDPTQILQDPKKFTVTLYFVEI